MNWRLYQKDSSRAELQIPLSILGKERLMNRINFITCFISDLKIKFYDRQD